MEDRPPVGVLLLAVIATLMVALMANKCESTVNTAPPAQKEENKPDMTAPPNCTGVAGEDACEAIKGCEWKQGACAID